MSPNVLPVWMERYWRPVTLMVDSARIKMICAAIDDACGILQAELPYFKEEFIEKSTPRRLFPFLVWIGQSRGSRSLGILALILAFFLYRGIVPSSPKLCTQLRSNLESLKGKQWFEKRGPLRDCESYYLRETRSSLIAVTVYARWLHCKSWARKV